MMTLDSYNRVGILIYIDKETKKPYLPLASYSRLSGVKRVILIDRIKDLIMDNPVYRNIFNNEGWLITEEVFCEWIFNDNPELAKEIMRASGVRDYLYNLAGYDNFAERLVKAMCKPSIPISESFDYFSVDFVIAYNQIEQPKSISQARLICYSEDLQLPIEQRYSDISQSLKNFYHRKVWGTAYPGLNYPE